MSLERAVAFQLGMQRQFTQAGITGLRQKVALELAAFLAKNPQATEQETLAAAKQAAALYEGTDNGLPDQNR